MAALFDVTAWKNTCGSVRQKFTSENNSKHDFLYTRFWFKMFRDRYYVKHFSSASVTVEYLFIKYELFHTFLQLNKICTKP